MTLYEIRIAMENAVTEEEIENIWKANKDVIDAQPDDVKLIITRTKTRLINKLIIENNIEKHG